MVILNSVPYMYMYMYIHVLVQKCMYTCYKNSSNFNANFLH